MTPRLRRAGPGDGPFLAQVLGLAADWHPGSEPRGGPEVLADPALAKYVADWPRPGDLGVVAELGSPNGPRGPVAGRGAAAEPGAVAQRIGAAWLRRFTAADGAYGFVDEATPELAIGVVPEARGAGVGQALISELLRLAAAERVATVSLSVELANPARRLYERLGFVEVGRVADSATMRRAI